MPSRKKRNRAKRRVMKTLEEAWEAVAKGELSLAEKLARRALDEGHVNPKVWLEHGRILWRCGREQEGEESLVRVLAFAPAYEPARTELLRMQAARGLAPPPAATAPEPEAGPEPEPDLSRTARYDWEAVAGELFAKGWALLPGLAPPGGDLGRLGRELGARAARIVAGWKPLLLAPVAGLELGARLAVEDAVFVMTDRRPGKRVHERSARLAAGDGVIFCASHRPLQVSGVLGLQPVTCSLRGGETRELLF